MFHGAIENVRQEGEQRLFFKNKEAITSLVRF